MIRLENVSKAVGGQPALRGMSLLLHGGCVAVVGPNGAGKTTLLRLLATLIRPDSGAITYRGADYARQVRVLRRSIGYVPQHADLPSTMTPRVLLRYLADIRQITDPERPTALLTRLRLGREADTPLAALSSGQVRLVCIAQALLAYPEILLLDGVFHGLGIEERQIVSHLLSTCGARLIVFSADALDVVEQNATEIIVLHQGRAIYAGRVSSMIERNSGETIDDAYVRLLDGDEPLSP